MKNNLFIVLLFFCSLRIVAQRADSIWYFGDHAGIDFTSGIPVALTNGQMQAWDNTSTISDINGDLLFYTNGVDAWGKNHNIMPNGNALGGNLSAGQSALIVPQPNSSKYYIFTVGYASGDAFRYSIVDMSLNSANGDVTTKANILFNGSTEKIDAAYNPNDTSYWVMTHAWNTNEYYCYKINSNGLQLTPVISTIGSVLSGGFTSGYNAIGQMTFSEDGTKLANAIYSDGKIEIFDFNVSTGTLSNFISMSGYTNSWGIAFSPNNQFLYFTEWYGVSIWQFDISSGIGSTIAASKTLVGTSTFATGSSGYKIGYLQNAPDGKIYAAKFGQYFISAISNPNSSGLGSNFIDNAVNLGNFVCNAGLSRTVKWYTWLNSNCSYSYFDTIQVCKGDSIDVNGTSYMPPVNVIDSLIDNQGCDSIVYTHIAQIQLPNISLGNDTSFCDGDSILLFVHPNFTSVQWNTGSNSDSIYVNSTGVYSVSVSDANCSNSDTINVINLTHSYIAIGDTSFCDGETWNISLAPQNQYQWFDGSISYFKSISDSGDYFVQITDNCKSYTDSFRLETEDCSCLIFVPNVFTPNNDGINDNFYPVINCELDDYQIYIFNRWGKLIFESSDQYEVWNGKYQGNDVPEGVYFYRINYLHLNTNSSEDYKTGSVTLYR